MKKLLFTALFCATTLAFANNSVEKNIKLDTKIIETITNVSSNIIVISKSSSKEEIVKQLKKVKLGFPITFCDSNGCETYQILYLASMDELLDLIYWWLGQ